MNKVRIVGILFLLVTVHLIFSGCLDIKGREICKESLDNLCLPDGYELLDYDSDFVSGDEHSYFVWYHISYNNKTEWIAQRPYEWFRYYHEEDVLTYSGNNETIKSWICN